MIKTVIFDMDVLMTEKKGLTELLSFLKTHRYTTVLVTDLMREEAVQQLKTADVEKYFDHMIFGEMVENEKPAPDSFSLAVKKSYTEPEECLALSSSEAGVKAAHQAGCHILFVADEISDTPELEDLSDNVVQSLNGVLNMMKTA